MIAIGDPEPVAAEIAMIAGMHRLVQIAHEMDQEGERHQPLARRHAAVGEQLRRWRSICADTQLPSRQARAQVERPADIDILIMPGRGVAEPLAEGLMQSGQ